MRPSSPLLLRLPLFLLFSGAHAFPFVADLPGVDSSLLGRRQQASEGKGSEALCPNNPNHTPAAPITAQFPYNGAINGRQGNGTGGYQVPAPGDTAHQYQAPNPKTDIRGPCPGLNTAANHGFLARDGIVTYNELVDAQQNVYNIGFDLANLLAVLGLQFTDGDAVTQKLSIGCDATHRTSFNPTLTGNQPGLDGHNLFEADSSLTRNDFYLSDGDVSTFNQTLFDMMKNTTGASYDLKGLALYRYQRYWQSRNENENFFFGPLALLLYGAASFLYEVMPSSKNGMLPDYATISSFFLDERIPDNWYNRVKPYGNKEVGSQIMSMYKAYPVLFGGNTGNGTFNAINFGFVENGRLPVGLSPANTLCLLYQLATGDVAYSLHAVTSPTLAAAELAASKLDPLFANLGCPPIS